MISSKYKFKKNIDIGKCIKIINSEKNYQVIGFNPKINICWVREWPLNSFRNQTFELTLNKITVTSSCEIKSE